MSIHLYEGETIESKTAEVAKIVRALESSVAQCREGSIERREDNRSLGYHAWILGQLEEMSAT